MKLSELFSHLSYGELSQLSLGNAESGGIAEENHERVLNAINLGLTALHTRFFLKEGRLKLQIQEGQQTYFLSSQYAVNNRRSREPVRYLLDTEASPYQDDLLKLERVLDSEGYELPLNDPLSAQSLFTPSYNSLVLPEGLEGTLTLVYRAQHPLLSKGLGFFRPETMEVNLPPSHLESLLFYVASRLHRPIGIGANGFHEGNSYLELYEAACMRLEDDGLQMDAPVENLKLCQNGWV